MATTPLSEVDVNGSPLPPVVEDVEYSDLLTHDRLDANASDDEYNQTWAEDSNDNYDVESTDEEDDRANIASALLEDPVENACITANKSFSATQDSGTPLKSTTHRMKEFEGSETIKKHLLEELGPMKSIPRADIVQWISPAYEHLATEGRINEFLSESGEYHKGRWHVIPRAPKLEKQLYDPVCELWNAILNYFGPPGIADMRKAFVTDRVPLKHHAIHTSSPDICVEASGPSFTLVPGEIIGFSNIATFADGKLERDALNLQAHMLQMGGYARQVFIQQPNRMFVRCLIITQRRARLFHFDRSGVQYSPLFDYHARPQLFIQLVLGLCSTDESVIGLDKSFQWITGPQGVKLGGILETVHNDKTVIKYDLDMEEEIFSRTSIRGRGTVCWPVKDFKTGERFLVKDYWMSEGRTPEYELLEKVRYTPGLCHMISHEEGRAETKDFRGDPCAFTRGKFHSRKSIRITIKFYGTSIDNFKSPEDMLSALRDAIQAHQVLYSMGILHRDITFNNILIGNKGFESEDGERGVIIDLDMAIENIRPILDICKDFRTGTIMFQSITVSKFFDSKDLGEEILPAQDYLDDLESFFWILVFLLFIYKPNGEKAPFHSFHDRIWELQEQATSYRQKSSFINNKSILHTARKAIHPDWHAACFDLFLQLHEFVHNIHQAKEVRFFDRMAPLPDGTVPNRFSDLLEDVNRTYKYIIALFDETLKELKESTAKEETAYKIAPEELSPG
ncbi:hypothetical protein EST38_g9687 [Candolleomyces aberdarensis]|uniref:Fungal-type protein kinase domain-containing protein n=1 Tax=Candolleomyces aberdarensis TaxID=2316362 RepID=A0A4Q2DA01_9AGAR|nr:hypothetical protein EST38_g9687 [Candolleomyces aberdarensis]